MTNTNPKPRHVFISYVRENKTEVLRLCKDLQKHGVQVWLDRNRIQPGTRWPDAIRDAIRHGDFFIACFSKEYADREKNYMNEELAFAIEELRQFAPDRKWFIPVLLSECELPALKIGGTETLRDIQWQNLYEDWERGINNLVDVIKPISHGNKSLKGADDFVKRNWKHEKVIISKHFKKTVFVKLHRNEPRSPKEMIKEVPKKNKLLPLLARIAKLKSIRDQLETARKRGFVGSYYQSHEERESQLFALNFLQEIIKRKKRNEKPISKVYDAGCGGSGLYGALLSFDMFAKNNFTYYGQDNNSEWQNRFNMNVPEGEFINKSLPLVKERCKCQLVCCFNTLQFFAQLPLAVYTSIFSFNTLLNRNGYCLIGVPEKDTQPGMLDLLEKSAFDAGFKILDAGRYRMSHNLTKEPAWNTTTYICLQLQKKASIETDFWKELLAVSLFRAKLKNHGIKEYSISKESQISSKARFLETELNDLIYERNYDLRFFLYALERACKLWATNNVLKISNGCDKKIKATIDEIHRCLNTAKKDKLTIACNKHLIAIMKWFLWQNFGKDIETTKRSVYPIVEEAIKRPKDVRVHIDDLTAEAVARLLRHLFEFSRYWKLDLKEKYELTLKRTKL